MTEREMASPCANQKEATFQTHDKSNSKSLPILEQEQCEISTDRSPSKIDTEIEVLQHQIAIEALKGIQMSYVCSIKPQASTVCDLVLSLQELLGNNLQMLQEVVNG